MFDFKRFGVLKLSAILAPLIALPGCAQSSDVLMDLNCANSLSTECFQQDGERKFRPGDVTFQYGQTMMQTGRGDQVPGFMLRFNFH